MYLLFLKGLRNLFFILTLINVPIMFIYASGTGTSILDMGTEKIFGTFNIGNLGQDSIEISSYYIWQKNKMLFGTIVEESTQHLHCTQEKLSRLIHVGLTTDLDTV